VTTFFSKKFVVRTHANYENTIEKIENSEQKYIISSLQDGLFMLFSCFKLIYIQQLIKLASKNSNSFLTDQHSD